MKPSLLLCLAATTAHAEPLFYINLVRDSAGDEKLALMVREAGQADRVQLAAPLYLLNQPQPALMDSQVSGTEQNPLWGSLVKDSHNLNATNDTFFVAQGTSYAAYQVSVSNVAFCPLNDHSFLVYDGPRNEATIRRADSQGPSVNIALPKLNLMKPRLRNISHDRLVLFDEATAYVVKLSSNTFIIEQMRSALTGTLFVDVVADNQAGAFVLQHQSSGEYKMWRFSNSPLGIKPALGLQDLSTPPIYGTVRAVRFASHPSTNTFRLYLQLGNDLLTFNNVGALEKTDVNQMQLGSILGNLGLTAAYLHAGLVQWIDSASTRGTVPGFGVASAPTAAAAPVSAPALRSTSVSGAIDSLFANLQAEAADHEQIDPELNPERIGDYIQRLIDRENKFRGRSMQLGFPDVLSAGKLLGLLRQLNWVEQLWVPRQGENRRGRLDPKFFSSMGFEVNAYGDFDTNDPDYRIEKSSFLKVFETALKSSKNCSTRLTE